MYREKYHVIYCDRSGREYRLGIQEWDYAYTLERRGHFNDVSPSEIGIYKEGFDFDFLQIGDTLIVSDSTVNNGTYTVTEFSSSVPPDSPYIRIQLSPQVPVQIHEDVTITIIPQSVRHKAAPVPFTVYEETTSELKIGGIYPSRAELRLLSSKTFNMEELYTADERKYYVTHEPTDGSDQGKWYGFIIPNGFSEEMDNDVHYMVLTASDNLGVLQNVPFLNPDTGENYGHNTGDVWRSFVWIAKEAFRKTGVILPIWTMVDVMPLLPNQGATVEKSASFFDGTITYANTWPPVLLQVGTTIKVKGGANDGRIFTVVSWVTSSVGYPPAPIIIITVDGDMVTDVGGLSVTLTISPPISPSDASDPLGITVQNVNTYVNEQNDDVEGVTYMNEAKNAKPTFEVLNNLAKQWNAKIYQNNGRWEIVRWNAYRWIDTGYRYFVYNAEGTYLGRAPFDSSVYYPCKGNLQRDQFRPFGHEIYMDRVLKRVSVSYIYKYKQDGDSLVNLIRNGNFGTMLMPGVPPQSSDPWQFTPQEWQRRNQAPSPMGLLAIQQTLSPPAPGVSYPPGIASFITMNGLYHDRSWLTSYSGYPTPVNAGDKLKISWWQSLWAAPAPVAGGPQIAALFVLRIIVLDPNDPQNWHMLVNDLPSPGNGNQMSRWVKFEGEIYNYVSRTSQAGIPVSEGYFAWEQITLSPPEVPIGGNVVVEIVGVASPTVSNPMHNPPNLLPTSFRAFMKMEQGNDGKYTLIPESRRFAGYPVRLSGFFVGKIVNPNNESVPSRHGYYYEQPGNYTDSIPDIEVLTGDDDQDDIISNVMVMQGSNRVHVRSWDTWAQEFGWSALGLLLAKSVMQMYYRPQRLIDGQFVSPNINWASRFSFESRPGELYAPLRGAIDPIHNRFNGTLTQVYDDAVPVIPDGGVDGGVDVTPNWQPTENSRCVRDVAGVNTGEVEVMEVDTNIASQTFGQSRWVVLGEDLTSCPIGDPIELLWGAQELLSPEELAYFPLQKIGDDYTVSYSNDGGNAYLRLLHRSSLGTVKSITYQGGYESISGWVYEADLMINGYLYKHMRLTWVTGVYDGLPVTFKIN